MQHVRVRCPNISCKKFMLLPRALLGNVAKCLRCAQPMQIQDQLQEDGITVASAAVEKTPTVEIRRCPYCKKRMRVPVTDPKQQILCPACKNIFSVENMPYG